MPSLNTIECGGVLEGNTGVSACPFIPKNFVGGILCPIGTRITKTQIENTLQTTLQNLCHAGRATRIYPLPAFRALAADNTEQAVKQTLGYGFQIIVRDGNYILSFQYIDGGLCVHKNLRLFNDGSWAVLWIDSNGVLIGTKDGDDLLAIPLVNFYAMPWGMNDGSNIAKFILEFQHTAPYLNEFVGFVPTRGAFNIDNVKGLQYVNLSQQAAFDVSAKKGKVKLITSCGNVSLGQLFGATLADNTAFVLKDKAGTTLALATSGVTYDAATDSYELTLDATGGYGTSVATDAITVNLGTPAALKALGVSGFEGIVQSFTLVP